MNNLPRRSRPNRLRRRLLTEQLEDRRLLAGGPYAPAAGQPGSTAISMSDPAIIGWATGWEDYRPGTEVGASWQTPGEALGQAEGTSAGIVALGRGGEITLRFEKPIRNGLGADFAVFENALTDTFLELGFVEVSSNGVDFFRFPNDSRTAEPVGSYDSTDPTQINGLAGKYRQGFGTPLDLELLKNASSRLDVSAVTHVRIIDIVGDGSTTDTSGDAIYDPYPTIGSAGFDLDAVGVINQVPLSTSKIDFEDVGGSLTPNGHWNGPDPNGTTITGAYDERTTVGQFHSGGASLNNAISLDSGAWNGFAYSNGTNTTTAGYLNPFSAFTGSGANGSSTYAVGFVDQSDFYQPPTLTLPTDAGTVSSIDVTNTTYAALSMRDGDSFAEKFGGVSGNDADWFLLTIEGKDDADASVGTVEFYLADYRFADSNLDYVVDTWQTLDVSSLNQATSLQFTLTSSDVGIYGMNTPAFFAVDEVVMVEPGLAIDFADYYVDEQAGIGATQGRVTRAGTSLDVAQVVSLQSGSPSVVIPSSVTIPAGKASVDFNISVVDNASASGDTVVTVTAAAGAELQTTRTLTIVDDDIPELHLAMDTASVHESQSVTATISRDAINAGNAITVQIESNLPSIASAPATVTLPAGTRSATFAIEGVDDEIDHGVTVVQFTVSATGFVPAGIAVDVVDNDTASIALSPSKPSFSESDAFPTSSFEDLGARLGQASFYNGADGAAEFVSGQVTYNNDYNPDFGSWSGWSYSNTIDTTTAGYLNQYSAFPGSGTGGSDTYAVASVYGIDPPAISRDPSFGTGFAEIDVTNTTYAALSMIEGDMFAKKFGGESGNDQDWFLLTIEGLNEQGSSVGTVEFYLADYRFDDNSLDYVVQDWVTVDVSSLGAATELRFSLTSSDNGDYGMNTPAYFAIDDVVVAPGAVADPASITVTREKMELTEAIDVTLWSSAPTLANVPPTVTIPAGQASIQVPVRVYDDWKVDGDQSVTFRASAVELVATTEVRIADDDEPTVTLTFLTPSGNESEGSPLADLERLGQGLTPETAYNGSDGAGSFASSGLVFNNDYNPEWASWSGWAYSNTTDATTVGYANQYSALPGSGANGSDTYAIGTTGGISPTIHHADTTDGLLFDSLTVTNTTYAALSMLNGDQFAKKFGGETGNDPDWMLLTIHGMDEADQSIGEMEFYLADFRFADNSLDYIVDAWTEIDLSSIAAADHLMFSLSSSDSGPFGMNTPAYFAVDNIQMASSAATVIRGIVHRNDANVSEPLVVDLSADHPAALRLPTSVTIPASDQTAGFTFTVVDDSMFDDDTLVMVEGNAGSHQSVGDTIHVIDNDFQSAGLRLSQSAGTTNVSESGTTDFVEVRLTVQPSSEVVVGIVPEAEGHFTVSETQMIFTSENWNIPQKVSFAGVPDFLIEENEQVGVRFEIVSGESDPAYAAAETGLVKVHVEEYAVATIELSGPKGMPHLRDVDSGYLFSLTEADGAFQWTGDDRDQHLVVPADDFGQLPVRLNLAGGDDTTEMPSVGMIEVDGGEGFDSLTILPTFDDLNLADFFGDSVRGFEVMVVAERPSGSIVIDSRATLVSLGPQVTTVIHAMSRPVIIDSAWTLLSPRMVNGAFMQVIGQGETEMMIESASPWQNVRDYLDVNHNGEVTASDALAIINQLQIQSGTDLPTLTSLDDFDGNYLDVSGDGELTAQDALIVINRLNDSVIHPHAESERIATGWSLPTTPEPSLDTFLSSEGLRHSSSRESTGQSSVGVYPREPLDRASVDQIDLVMRDLGKSLLDLDESTLQGPTLQGLVLGLDP
ncbi:DUF4465 domain-containing protein [Novipirellula artificiosorum]|uniref:Dockerin type I repeat protein n=1 Tax=Novipirellula artificiosorum TaxID=2528016 RepID=A0A5C6DZL5_9BACT|nr:DUF4465 domain-containing protein [Novipirellula artificiosorum]TWU42088.1 Dockerin type I repeat protein [Novipirellula artificiosorum]